VNPFQLIKNNWEPGDTREVECPRIDLQQGVEYDSYRRIYIADGCEWQIRGKIAQADGRSYYFLECTGAAEQ
jgi:hypothetical protein